MVMMQGALPGSTMPLDRNRRLALGPQSLSLEVRGASRNWNPARTIRYDEIIAVFRYETRDWGYLGIAFVYWLAAVTAGGVAAAAASMSAATVGWGILIVTLIVAVLATVRISTRPRRLLRIEAHSGAFVFPNSDDQFFRSLAAHLPRTEAAHQTEPGRTASIPGIPGAAPEPYALGLDLPRQTPESSAPESTSPYLAWPGSASEEMPASPLPSTLNERPSTPGEAPSVPASSVPQTPGEEPSMLDGSPENENRSTRDSP